MSLGAGPAPVSDVARPRCFLKVSRLEAQLLLERYPECGNLLLRPSGDGAGGVSVTTLQTLNGCACAVSGGRASGTGRGRSWGVAMLWVGPGRGLPVDSIRAWFSRGILPGAGSFLKVESFEGLIPRREPRPDVGWSGSGPSWGRGPGEGRALPCPTARSCTRPLPCQDAGGQALQGEARGRQVRNRRGGSGEHWAGSGEGNGVGCAPSTPALIASPL